MLILIGTVPTAYALNRTMPQSQVEAFISNSDAASKVISAKAGGHQILGNPTTRSDQLCRPAPDQ